MLYINSVQFLILEEKYMGDVIIENNQSSGFKPMAAGTYAARCVGVVDLGTRSTEWSGETKWQKKIVVLYEVWDKPEEPTVVQTWYTNSLYEGATLSQHLTAWRGRPFTEMEKQKFNISKDIVGVPCYATVTNYTANNGTERHKISNISPLPKEVKCNDKHNECISFSLADYISGNRETFNQLPENLRERVLEAQELQGTENNDDGDGNNGADDFTPF